MPADLFCLIPPPSCLIPLLFVRRSPCAWAPNAVSVFLTVRAGDAETLPVDDASVDVVISNGVLNLVPDKRKAYSEIARVLRPGGSLLLADIAVEVELEEKIRSDMDLWTD